MQLIYSPSLSGSTTAAPGIPNKGMGWPDSKLRATPPPQPQRPLLSLVYPMLPRNSGPASVA